MATTEGTPTPAPVSTNDVPVNVSTDPETRSPQTELTKGEPEGVPRVSPEEVKLRQLLRFHRYAPIKLKGGRCHLHLLYCLVMLLQLAKIVLITVQMVEFGDDRSSFSSVVNRGHITLRHLLLKSWDSGRETLPYPPAQGDFAIYEIKKLLDELNYAVEGYYNIENEAIGFYKLYNRTDHNDAMVIRMKYFEFPGFDDLASGLVIKNKVFRVKSDIGMTTTFDPKTKKTMFHYDIAEAFDEMNLTEPIKRLLSIDLDFSFHAVRIYEDLNSALCLFVKGTVSFHDEDNNGQMLIDLTTNSGRKKCSEMNLSVPDLELDRDYKTLGIFVVLMCGLSVGVSLWSIIFGVVLFRRTREFMSKHYNDFYGPEQDVGSGLKHKEWVKFFTYLLWDLAMLVSDISTIVGTARISFESWTRESMLSSFDSTAIWLTIGGFLGWLYILKIFKIHHKFQILFKTLCAAFIPMMAYILCIAVLFVGFFLCGYVVLGPYHVKFATVSSTVETLFSVSNGDEIYATLANVETSKSGTRRLAWFSRVYVCLYVAVFTIVVLNILVAIFVGAHDTIKEERAKTKQNRNYGVLENTLFALLAKIGGRKRSTLKSQLIQSLDGIQEDDVTSTEIEQVKSALEKLWRTQNKEDLDNNQRPLDLTLKAFVQGKYQNNRDGCCSKFVCYVRPQDF